MAANLMDEYMSMRYHGSSNQYHKTGNSYRGPKSDDKKQGEDSNKQSNERSETMKQKHQDLSLVKHHTQRRDHFDVTHAMSLVIKVLNAPRRCCVLLLQIVVRTTRENFQPTYYHTFGLSEFPYHCRPQVRTENCDD